MHFYLKTIIVLIFICFQAQAVAQAPKTVGLLTYESDAYNGYTLFSPMSSNITFLIDNCGEKVKEWNFQSLPGLLAYLHKDGSIFRAERSAGSFGAGGSGGKIVQKSWEDELIWSYTYSDDLVRHHHDFQVLSNGNILLLAWERKTREEAVQAGRISSLTSSDGVWFEHVVELEPIGLDSAAIVWEWHVFDHLVQERDSTLDNFGDVDQSPHRFHVNYNIANQFSPNEPGNPDWMHMNAIQYNETRDEILLSSRDFNEIYIIDHSTTTEEARTSIGGNSGKGGDILFRWGNNAAFNKGNVDDQIFFAQHHSAWNNDLEVDEVAITVFNNGIGSSSLDTSSVEFLTPTLINNDYVLSSDGTFIVDEHKTLFDNQILSFSSPRLSSAQILDNQNILIASGNHGRILEITKDEEIVWDYINPINNSGAITQGENPFAIDIFRAMRYSIDSEIFEDRDLSPQGILEIDPSSEPCIIIDTTVSNTNVLITDAFRVYPNPINDIIYFDLSTYEKCYYEVLDVRGKVHIKGESTSNTSVDFSQLLSGIYFLKLRVDNSVQIFKIVKG